jgi:hypothetical protein
MPELAGHVRGIHPVTYLPPKIRLAVCNTRKPEREEKIGWMDSQEKNHHKFTMKDIGWKGNSVHKGECTTSHCQQESSEEAIENPYH